MYSESSAEIMVLCLPLNEENKVSIKFVVDIPKETWNNKKISHLQELVKEKRKIAFSKFDASDLCLWKVAIPTEEVNGKIDEKMKILMNKPHSEIDIEKELRGLLLKAEKNIRDFIDENPPDDQIHIIVQPPLATELGRKRPITGEESRRPKKKKWETNGAIRKFQRDTVYFVDPLELSEPLLAKIRSGDFVALYGARATGKSTRVLKVIDKLEEEGFFCIYVTLEFVNIQSEDRFWTTFGHALINNVPEYIKDRIISGVEFANLFLKNKWEKQVIIFIDEYDKLYRASDVVRSSFLETIRGIKTTKDTSAIWSINAIGPFSILHLSSNSLTTSPFNVKEPIQNPNFTQEQVQILFKEFADGELMSIDPEVVNDIYLRTSGHAGLVCLCGKAIYYNLTQELDEKRTLGFSAWLGFITSSSLGTTMLDYPTFRKLISTFQEPGIDDNIKLAMDLLRSTFIGFFDFVPIYDVEELRLAEFLVAEGVLTRDKNENKFKMSSIFLDELFRRRVIPYLYKSCPEIPVPHKNLQTLDILPVLKTAIRFFDKNIITNAFSRSFKIARDLYVSGMKGQPVPRESVYDTEMNRILVNWLLKNKAINVTGQWHLVEDRGDEKDKHTYSDIVITTSFQTIVLELLATATEDDLYKHFVRVLYYAKQLDTDNIWIVHFTCQDYAKPYWPLGKTFNKINVVHCFHNENFDSVRIVSRSISDNGTFNYADDVIQLQ